MGGRGKVVRNAAIFGHHKIINSMRRTQSIGLDIEKEGERCQKGPNPEHSKCCPEGAFRHPRTALSKSRRVTCYMRVLSAPAHQMTQAFHVWKVVMIQFSIRTLRQRMCFSLLHQSPSRTLS